MVNEWQRASPGRLLPPWLSRLSAYCAAALLIGVALWALVWVLAGVSQIVLTLAVALLLAALLHPVFGMLRRLRAPRWLAALGTVLFLLLVPVGIGYLVVTQALQQVPELRRAATEGLADARRWLVEGPLSLSQRQVDQVYDEAVRRVRDFAPDPVAGATLALTALGGALLALFVLFFLLKDGERMWRWALDMAPAAHRGRLDGAAREAWSTLSGYVVGTALVALIDALAIGVGLWLLGVPMALSLGLLVFVGAFVPFLGATLSGALAIAVALAANGPGTALAALALVIGVQQLEGNLLQPLILGRSVSLHPIVVLVSVAAGFLVAGIGGAVVAVPLVAVAYRVAVYLRDTAPREAVPSGAVPDDAPPTGTLREDAHGVRRAGGAAPRREARRRAGSPRHPARGRMRRLLGARFLGARLLSSGRR